MIIMIMIITFITIVIVHAWLAQKASGVLVNKTNTIVVFIDSWIPASVTRVFRRETNATNTQSRNQ